MRETPMFLDMDNRILYTFWDFIHQKCTKFFLPAVMDFYTWNMFRFEYIG